jgi:ABC-type antimicrobial peptide transport system permease subunit
VGIGGVAARSLVQRTKEIGVRTTLDAQPRGGVLGMVVSRSVASTLAAPGTGLPASFGLLRWRDRPLHDDIASTG